jgi:hypothetical protein
MVDLSDKLDDALGTLDRLLSSEAGSQAPATASTPDEE